MGRAGVGLPYVVAFHKWWNTESLAWTEREAKRVRKLAELIEVNGGELDMCGDKFLLFQQDCHRTGMIVYGAEIRGMRYFNALPTFAEHNIDDIMASYHGCQHPSCIGLRKFGPLTMEDLTIFKDARSYILNMKKQNSKK